MSCWTEPGSRPSRPGCRMTGRWYELQTYGASQDAPVSEVTWTCCL